MTPLRSRTASSRQQFPPTAQWEKFCEVDGIWKSCSSDPRYATNEARGEHYDAEAGERGLREITADKFRDMTRREIAEPARSRHNIPGGPGYTVDPKHLKDEQLNTRNMVAG